MRSAFGGDLQVFRGKRGHLIKILWHKHRRVDLRQPVGARQVYLAAAGRRHEGDQLN